MEISIEKTIEIFQGMKKGISPWYPEEYYNFAIDIMRKYQKIEQIKNDSLYDIYMAGVNMTGEYQGCWVRFKDIENIVNEHFSGGLDKNSQKLELQEQEPKPMVEIDLYSVIKQKYIERKVLDKIREQIKSYLRGMEITLEVLVENDPLRPKVEGAKDSLEECLELIDKAETENP